MARRSSFPSAEGGSVEADSAAGGRGGSGIAGGDGQHHIHVVLRLRPMNKLEASRRSRNCVEVHDDGTTLTVDSPLEGEYDFKFDRVFDQDASQLQVYDRVGHPMARAFLRGYNCCIFAYGQTGTGKTHTMMGVSGEDVSTPAILETPTRLKANAPLPPKAEGNSLQDEQRGRLASDDDRREGNVPEGGGVEDEPDEGSGIIPRIVHDIFQLLKEAPPNMEYTVRCSYVEIYLEKILDLLEPSTSRKLSIQDRPATANEDNGGGGGGIDAEKRAVNILNVSEACCVDESDVISLLVRGNACRTVAANKMNTDSSRSHALFLLHLDQLDELTGETRRGTLSLLDLAGSEYGGKPQSRQTATQGQNLIEAKMIHRGLSALNQVVRTLGSGGRRGSADVSLPGASSDVVNEGDLTKVAPYRNSKLTRLLRPALGGNCLTSIVVTASSSSYNIHETLNTIRFGQRARRITNRRVCPNMLKGPLHYRRMWENERVRRSEMAFLLERVRKEVSRGVVAEGEVTGDGDGAGEVKCDGNGEGPDKSNVGMGTVGGSPQAPGEESKSEKWESFGGDVDAWYDLHSGVGSSPCRFSHSSPLWESIDQVLQESKDLKVGDDKSGDLPSSSAFVPPRDNGRPATSEDGVESLRRELQVAIDQRNQAENAIAEMQSEIAVLRSQNMQSEQDKKHQSEDIMSANNENQMLVQRLSDMDQKLRTSMFRESEATVFLRQFRRFYRRLLRHKASQGTGEVPDLITKVPGVPDLNDLIDVDTLLYESGLIEESELYDDTSVVSFQPSQKALQLSHRAMKRSARSLGSSVPSVDEECATVGGAQDEGVDPDRGGTAGRLPPSGRKKKTAVREDASVMDQSEFGESVLRSDTDSNASSETETGTSGTHSIRPGGRMNSNAARVQTLQKELNQVTEKCIELQIALNEEKAKVDVLTNRAGTLNRKRLAQEAVQLREALDKKTHDLQAIIWKMNELHLINKTYSEKMANRDQHVTYLEDNLRELQDGNRRYLAEKHDAVKRLRGEMENLQVLVDAMTIPLWQFGECGVTGRSLASRIYLPIRSEAQMKLFAMSSRGIEVGGEKATLDLDDAQFEPQWSPGRREANGQEKLQDNLGVKRGMSVPVTASTPGGQGEVSRKEGTAVGGEEYPPRKITPRGIGGPKEIPQTSSAPAFMKQAPDEIDDDEFDNFNRGSGGKNYHDSSDASIISDGTSVAFSVVKGKANRPDYLTEYSQIREDDESSSSSSSSSSAPSRPGPTDVIPNELETGLGKSATLISSFPHHLQRVPENMGMNMKSPHIPAAAMGTAGGARAAMEPEIAKYRVPDGIGQPPHQQPPQQLAPGAPPPLISGPSGTPPNPNVIGGGDDAPLPCMEGMELNIPSDGGAEEVSVVTSHFNEPSYMGGKPQSFVPRRFAPKKGLNIRTGVVRDTKRFSAHHKSPPR